MRRRCLIEDLIRAALIASLCFLIFYSIKFGTE
jgi:hypothetical protein